MKAVIPVKASSLRVPNKNFRPFYNRKSLFDLTVEKLLRYLPADDIYMSCEDPMRESLADKWNINFLLRDKRLTENETPMTDVVTGVCDMVPGDSDLMWCQVIDPLFDAYEECLQQWQGLNGKHDSLVVVYPHRSYFLDVNHRPEGFGFGAWHISSQCLPQRYQLTFTLSILSRRAVNRTRYYIGENPYWYEASNIPIDIDTPEDFELAQVVYKHFAKKC